VIIALLTGHEANQDKRQINQMQADLYQVVNKPGTRA